MCLHELGFMYAIQADWMAASRTFATVAGDNLWMRPYHYFMATGKKNTTRHFINALFSYNSVIVELQKNKNKFITFEKFNLFVKSNKD